MQKKSKNEEASLKDASNDVTTVSVSRDTYVELLAVKSMLTQRLRKTVSWDKVQKYLVDIEKKHRA